MLSSIFMVLSTLAAAHPVAPQPSDVVAAERAFAAMAKAEGIGPAFRAFSADDAISLEPDPVPLKPLLAEQGDPPGGLEWWPAFSGVAASGDLAFNLGPFVRKSAAGETTGQGWFFTIWRRQPDGSWRWVLDHGAPSRELAGFAPTEAPVRLTAVAAASGAETGTWAELVEVEAALARRLADDAHAAYPAALAEDGRVIRPGPQPAVGLAAFTARVGEGPKTLDVRHLGGAVSAAGDLAYTYGRADWSRPDGKRALGNYVRVWQRRGDTWKIVVDEVTTASVQDKP